MNSDILASEIYASGGRRENAFFPPRITFLPAGNFSRAHSCYARISIPEENEGPLIVYLRVTEDCVTLQKRTCAQVGKQAFMIFKIIGCACLSLHAPLALAFALLKITNK